MSDSNTSASSIASPSAALSAHPVESLAGLELAQLVALEQLLRTRSVTVSAQKLRVSQSAMSHTLRRLRELFEDPLLVRGKAGMVLTPRAEALREPLSNCLRELRSLTSAPRPFAPAASRQRFRLGATDFLALRFAPGLLALAQREAPHVSFEIMDVPLAAYAEALERGELDLMVAGGRVPDHLGLMRRDLANEEMACAARRGHPRIRGPLRLEDYVEEGHLLVVSAQRESRGVVDEQLDRLGMKRTVAACVSSFLLAPHLVARSDLLLTAPRALLETYAAPLGLEVRAAPVELCAFAVRLLWHERTHADAAHRWLRELVQRAYGELDLGSPATARPRNGR